MLATGGCIDDIVLGAEPVKVKDSSSMCAEGAARGLDSRFATGKGGIPGDNDEAEGGVVIRHVRAQVLQHEGVARMLRATPFNVEQNNIM